MVRVYYNLGGNTYRVECERHEVAATISNLRAQGLIVHGYQWVSWR